MKGFSKTAPVLAFVITALGIAALVFFPLPRNVIKTSEAYQTRIIVPQSPGSEKTEGRSGGTGRIREAQLGLKVPLEDNEVFVAVLTGDFSEELQDGQFVAYRKPGEIDGSVYLCYIAFDYEAGVYRRVWSAPSAASVPATVSLSTKDLTGDRSLCVLLAGMNNNEEQTFTAFRKNPAGRSVLFSKIAELQVDGSIAVRETPRSQAYQLGIANGASFEISAYGRDFSSSNIMDQLEYTYTFNESEGFYEQNRVVRVPGVQIEQRRVRELLGNRAAFEEFVTGLWYYVNPQNVVDSRQYIYFDPANREIIFYGDETQQVFIWQNSAATRYGLYLSSQNISVSTMRRSIDISLESLESIQVKVFEDVHFRVGISAPWDGTYRKVSQVQNQNARIARNDAYVDAVYDSSIGRIKFSPDGNCELLAGGETRQGKYAFFYLENHEVLELRFSESPANSSNGTRETYLVMSEQAVGTPSALRKDLSLEKIRLGARGVERLFEGPVILNLAEE